MKIGHITFAKAYNRHYANRFGAAPTNADAEQNARDFCEGLRKEAFMRRDLGLAEHDPLPEESDEIKRWRVFKERQETVQDEIVAALKVDEIRAFYNSDQTVPPDYWQDFEDELALTRLFRHGKIERGGGYKFSESLSHLNEFIGEVDRCVVLYVNEQAFEEWSQSTCRAAQPKQHSINLQKYDPLTLVEWSLPMAAAWIVWRDINEVRDYWDDYLAAYGQDPLPYHVVDIEGCLGSDIGQGLRQLRDAISKGHLQARKGGATQHFTRLEWTEEERLYRLDDVWVFRESVIDLWPAKTEPRELVEAIQTFGSLHIERKWVEDRHELFLGEVVAWWISRGIPVGTQEAADQWDDAVADVIDAIAKGEIAATGIPGGGYSETVDPACCGRKFAEYRTVLIKPTNPDRDFSGLASGEIRVARLGEVPYCRSWQNVTMAAAEVLTRWPELAPSPAASATGNGELAVVFPKAQSKLSGTVSAMQETIRLADKFLKSQNYAPLTKTEAEEEILPQMHNGTRPLIRKAIALIKRRDKRRPLRQLVNRPKELEDCRQFLRSAT